MSKARGAKKVPERAKTAETRAAADAPASAAVTPTATRRAVISAYNRIVVQSQLVGVRLVQSQFTISPEYFGYDEHPSQVHELAMGGDIIDVETNKALGGAVGVFQLWVEARDKKTRDTRMRIECSYLVEYSGLDLSTKELDDAARLFVRRVGRFAAFPYARALASRYSDESGASLPPLPVLKDGAAPAQPIQERIRSQGAAEKAPMQQGREGASVSRES